MERFASGWKRNYYGKGDVIVYRLRRDGNCAEGECPVFGASIKMLVYGDAFWPTYTTGDNSGLIATDSMKNFIQRESLGYAGGDLDGCCRMLAAKFLETYPQVEGVQVSAEEIPYGPLAGSGIAFVPAGPERATARIELTHAGVVERASGLTGFKLLRLGGSAFHGFVRDEYTTLPDIRNRPLHMWLDLEWRYTDPVGVFTGAGPRSRHAGSDVARVRAIVYDVFQSFESGSIQQVIYQMGTRILAELPTIADVHL